MQLSDKIKKDFIFRKVNLIDANLEKRFTKKFQAIFCRNVMIYFNDTTRTTLVNKLYDMLDDEGYLFVGHSESLNYSKSKFKYVTPAVYRK
jgi:chemotaxis protein methyltransferase CheR